MNVFRSIGHAIEWAGRSLAGDGRADGSGRTFAGPNYTGVPMSPNRA